MKIYSATIHREDEPRLDRRDRLLPKIAVSGADMLAALGAIAVASLVVLLSVLAAGVGVTGLLGAMSWGLGLVFLALAIDNHSPVSVLQCLTGLAIMLLAWLQFNVSPDFIVITGVLLAAWLSSSLFRTLR
jgi:hypothetical protein